MTLLLLSKDTFNKAVGAGASIGSDEFDEKDVQFWDFEPVGGSADHMRSVLVLYVMVLYYI